MKLYRSKDFPGEWIGDDEQSYLMRWKAARNGWAKRVPHERSRRGLEEVEPALARGTGWPGGGTGPAPRAASGKASETQIGIRATTEERAAWERAAAIQERTLAAWARDELNVAAERTLPAEVARPKRK